jgi:uncharacterized protein (DUF305 family)
MHPTMITRGVIATLITGTVVIGTAGPVQTQVRVADASVAASRAEPRHTAGHQSPDPYPVSPTAYDYAETLRDLRGALLEKTYLGGMVAHHQGATAMAQMELEKGSRSAAKRLATRIIEAQQREIVVITRRLHDWYGLTPTEAVAAAPREARRELAAMEAEMSAHMEHLTSTPSGPQFDREFLRLMIPHHRTAILESRAAIGRMPHEQSNAMAGDIIHSQSREVRLMRHWLRAWYGRHHHR